MLGDLFGAATSFLGGLFNRNSSEKAAAVNLAAQRDFAQNGIQWKVEDAKKAGIHPLAALGAQTVSFSPSYVGDTSFGTGVANMGQDISRAINSTRSAPARVEAFSKTMQDLQLTNAALQNEQLAIQNAKLKQAGSPPPMQTVGSRYLIDGQGSTALGSLVSDKPLERVVSAPGSPHMEPGAIPDVGFARTQSGYAPVPSLDVKQRIEDNLFQEAQHFIRNNIMPSFQMNLSPPYAAPAGKKWVFNPFKQEYQLYRDRRYQSSGW